MIAPYVVPSPDRTRISWVDFRDYTGVFMRPLAPSAANHEVRPWDLPDLHFDRAQYLAEVRRITSDGSWETPRRQTARLLEELLRSMDRALAESGLSQAAFATALGTSASRLSTYRSGRTKPTAQFFLRAGRIARALHAAREYRIMTAPDTATAIREASDEEWAWRMLLQGRDHLRLLLRRHDGSEAAWEAAPGTTGQAGFDALLAVLTAHEFDAAGEDPPEWTKVDPLPDRWIPEHPFLDHDEIIEQTPDYLAQANIFIPARDLVTA